jgi:hypothetical protein
LPGFTDTWAERFAKNEDGILITHEYRRVHANISRPVP